MQDQELYKFYNVYLISNKNISLTFVVNTLRHYSHINNTTSIYGDKYSLLSQR